MRLLNTSSLKLCDFDENSIPPYAILSHTWAEEEVSLQDIQQGNCDSMIGYAKIKSLSQKARTDKWEFVWVDTCCIDKTSSAELSEAINSMFKWYQDAGMCYTYLPDVFKAPDFSEGLRSEFCKSRWFTRGWCLQELLASRKITFLGADWKVIGNKISLAAFIVMRTGIKDLEYWNDFCIAVKFSWMAGRKTTRAEDMAYSLIGICGVNMVPIYGEGEQKAFLRLQLNILQASDDETIFAWNDNKDLGSGRGLLAPVPSAFEGSGWMVSVEFPDIPKMVGIPAYKAPGYRAPFAMTNKGLHMEVPVLSHPQISANDPISKVDIKGLGGGPKRLTLFEPRRHDNNIMLVPILCTGAGSKHNNWLGIVVRRVSGPFFARIGVRRLEDKEQENYLKGGSWVDMYIKQYKEDETPFEGRVKVVCNYGEDALSLRTNEIDIKG